MYEFKQSSSGNMVHVSIANSTTGLGVTSLAHDSPTFVLKKPGSAAAAKLVAGSEWTEVGGGWYEVKLLAGDVDTLGSCLLVVTPSGGGPEGGYPFDVVANIASDVKTDSAAIKAKTDNLPSTPAAQSDVTTVGTAVAAVSTKLGTPAASVSADVAAVKTDTAAVRTNVDVAVSTRLATIGYTAPDNTSIAAAVTAIAVLHGLMGANSFEDTFVYGGPGGALSSSRLRTYDTAAHAQAAGATGLLKTYTMTFAYSGADLASVAITEA